MDEEKRGPLWRHVKTGGHYREIARGRIESTLEPVVIYRSLITGKVWVRPETEFDDGRFVQVFLGEVPA